MTGRADGTGHAEPKVEPEPQLLRQVVFDASCLRVGWEVDRFGICDKGLSVVCGSLKIFKGLQFTYFLKVRLEVPG